MQSHVTDGTEARDRDKGDNAIPKRAIARQKKVPCGDGGNACIRLYQSIGITAPIDRLVA